MTDERIEWLTATVAHVEQVATMAAEAHTSRQDGRPFWPRARVVGLYRGETEQGLLAGLDLIRWASPQTALARVEADRRILAEIQTWRHVYNDDDPWYSCSQAASTWEEDRSPGSGCIDEDRAGKPCDCGLDRRRAVIVGALLSAWRHMPGFREEWING